MNVMPGKIGSKWKNTFVLIYFHEEKKYTVQLLKEVVPTNLNLNNDYDFSEWNKSEIVKAVWGNEEYPAYFLKFSENRNELEEEGVELAKSFEQKDQDTKKVSASKKLKTSQCKEIKKKTEEELMKKIGNQENDAPDKKTQRNYSILKQNNRVLKRKIEELTSEIDLKDKKNFKLEKKLNKYKTKYRQSIDQLNEQSLLLQAQEDLVQIGPSVLIPKSKSLLLRNNSYSKYTGDLMEVVFGSEKLCSHVLKGIKGNKKTDKLDSNMLQDIECHVISKFGVTKQMVRYAMRLKLNYAHKMKKRETII